jgi:hypothetical protein
MNAPMDINAILEGGEWDRWRNTQLGDVVKLTVGARAWCASSYWDRHTPPLEAWKVVVADLAHEGLSEAALTQIAGGSGRKTPFPPIPLFEDEQVRDVCQILTDADAAAAMAEALSGAESLLTVGRKEAPQLCWEAMNPNIKAGLDFSAWRWMFSGEPSKPLSLPGREGVAALWNGTSPRRAEAIRRLKLVTSSTPETVADGSAEKDSMRMRDDPGNRNRLLCDSLFGASFDPTHWKAIEQDALSRTEASSGPHPLSEMATHLRNQDYPVEVHETAWSRLRQVFAGYHGLLDIDGLSSANPLPALELSAAVCPERTIGKIATDLVLMAAECRQKASWWRALKAGLQPMVRRGGWRHANDRANLAERILRLQTNWLSVNEASAMETGFSLGEKR